MLNSCVEITNLREHPVGPVLLDFPYVYKLDGSKLICNSHKIDSPYPCGGNIDYDDGFNVLICDRCGKRHDARELRDESPDITIMKGRGNSMKMQVELVKNGVVLSESSGDEVINYKQVPVHTVKKKFKAETIRSAVETPTLGQVLLTGVPDENKAKRIEKKKRKMQATIDKHLAAERQELESAQEEPEQEISSTQEDTTWTESSEDVIDGDAILEQEKYGEEAPTQEEIESEDFEQAEQHFVQVEPNVSDDVLKAYGLSDEDFEE